MSTADKPAASPPKAMFMLEQDLLIVFNPPVPALPASFSKFQWKMHFSLPYPFPSKTCVKREVTIENKPFKMGIHNHYNRVIQTFQAPGVNGPSHFRAVLEDKRTPIPNPPGCIFATRDALPSAVIFEEATEYVS